MSTGADHRRIESLLGAYALDALEDDEAEVVRAHVAGCPGCRAEVDAHREMAGAMGNLVEAVPAGLWDRIAREVGASSHSGRDRALWPLAGGRDGPLGAPGGPGPLGPSRAPGGPGPIGLVDRTGGRGERARWGRVPVLLAGVAVVVAALLGVGLVRADHQVSQARAALAARGDAGALAAALATPGHQLVEMRSAGGQRLAEFVVVPGGRGYLVSSGLAALPAGETYQLWALIQGKPISLGLLGNRPAQGSFSLGDARPSTLAVTVEPAGGVAAPDRSPVATGSVEGA